MARLLKKNAPPGRFLVGQNYLDRWPDFLDSSLQLGQVPGRQQVRLADVRCDEHELQLRRILWRRNPGTATCLLPRLKHLTDDAGNQRRILRGGEQVVDDRLHVEVAVVDHLEELRPDDAKQHREVFLAGFADAVEHLWRRDLGRLADALDDSATGQRGQRHRSDEDDRQLAPPWPIPE